MGEGKPKKAGDINGPSIAALHEIVAQTADTLQTADTADGRRRIHPFRSQH
jgi:hypothetical protein